MKNINYFILARALHVVGVVFWIGGVAFVTTVLIPSLKKIPDEKNRLDLFEKLEGRFSFQAKVTTIVTGVTGVYMLYFLNAWDRYSQFQYWWIHLMTIIWLIFTIILFILEPLFLHNWFKERAKKDSKNAFTWLHRMHITLLILSILAVLCAMAASHGFTYY